ncbi:MAG TPA: carboxypeptidase regulatory-like domain-containing protein, partial [Armatimonadota bacterium]|nr:carboxypeptidase regulatory-like domain-containing protein [Armatimonadota bacterium]
AAPGAAPVNLSDTGRDGPALSLRPWNGVQPNGGISLMLVSPFGAPAGAPITVSGRVLDHGETARPVGGVPVAVYVQNETTGAGVGGYVPPLDAAVSNKDGSVSLLVPAAGAYRLAIGYGDWHGVYWEASHTIKVPPKGLDGQVFAVSRRPTLQVRVLSADGGPVAGKQMDITASVSMPTSETGYSGATVTEPNGIAKLHVFGEVNTTSVTGVDIAIHAGGIGAAHIHLDAWPRQAVDVKLATGRQIEGRVIGPAGGPVNGARVLAQLLIDNGRFPSFDSMGSASTGEDGAFTLTGLAPGYYALTATSDNSSSTTLIADAQKTNPQPLRLQLKTGLSITGRLLDAAGFSVPNTQIQVFRLNDQWAYPNFSVINTHRILTDATGRFRITGLRPGFYYLAAQTRDQRFAGAHLELAEGKPVAVTLRFSAGVSASVRVMDTAGKPVTGAQVTSYRMTPENQSVGWSGGPVLTTGDDGRCVLENVTPGQYLLVATAPGMGRAQRLAPIDAHSPEIILTPGDHL